jgi:YD repeat-containing protein
VPGITRTNEWDSQDRLVAVNVGNQRTEFTYDGIDRRVAIRQHVNGVEVSRRRFVWCGGEICEERNAAGAVTKRFLPQGVKIESGAGAGTYFYTRDHLGPTNWFAVPGEVSTSNRKTCLSDALTASNRFYRVRVLP